MADLLRHCGVLGGVADEMGEVSWGKFELERHLLGNMITISCTYRTLLLLTNRSSMTSRSYRTFWLKSVLLVHWNATVTNGFRALQVNR